MSRCFPFPPPGCVLKARADDDVKLIIKEKKQKKHKDKKDKDKKENKDKEKERSEGKHKNDKKRKREKHKDKKEKKKQKVSSLEEKKILGSSENQNGEKLVPDSILIDRIEDKRTFSELGDRVRNNGASGNKMVRKITFVEKSKVNVQENSNGRMANGQIVKVDAKSLGNGFVEKSLGNGFAGKSLGNGLVENCYGENTIKVRGGLLEKVEKRKEGKERNGLVENCNGENTIKVKGGSSGNFEKRKERNETNVYPKRICEGEGSKKEERNKNAKAEDKRRKEEKKEKVTVSDFHANNPLDLVKELIVSSHENGLRPNNLLCHQAGKKNGILPNNISRPVLQHYQAGQNGSGLRAPQNMTNLAVEKKAVCTNQKINGKLSSPQSVIKNGMTLQPCQNGKMSINEFNNGCISPHLVHIRREVDPFQTTNGGKVALMENGGKTAMQGLDATCTTNSEKNSLVENGLKMTVQGPDVVKKMQRADGGEKTGSKELRMNGTLESKDGISSKTSSAKIKVKEKIDASKPPHPDLKFLGQILSIPQVEQTQCHDDDQEWLFGCKDSQVKRPKLASSQNLVWAEAMMLESVDVTALPYVIPY